MLFREDIGYQISVLDTGYFTSQKSPRGLKTRQTVTITLGCPPQPTSEDAIHFWLRDTEKPICNWTKTFLRWITFIGLEGALEAAGRQKVPRFLLSLAIPCCNKPPASQHVPTRTAAAGPLWSHPLLSPKGGGP